MKIILTVALFVFCIRLGQSQPAIKAILKENLHEYRKNDTVALVGQLSTTTDSLRIYLVKSVDRDVYKIKSSQLVIIDTFDNFWDKQWFTLQSGRYWKKDNYLKSRENLTSLCKDYAKNLIESYHSTEYKNVQAYFNNTFESFKKTSNYKNKEINFKIYLLKLDDPHLFSFDSGEIFISTAFIAHAKTFDELEKAILKEIAHVLCDHQLQRWHQKKNNKLMVSVAVNSLLTITAIGVIANSATYINNATSVGSNSNSYAPAVLLGGCYYYTTSTFEPSQNVMLKYTKRQKTIATQIADNYFLSHNTNQNGSSTIDYTQAFTEIMSQTAWNYYYQGKFKESIALVNRIESAGVAGAEYYLLKAKLYNSYFRTDEANYEALQYLQLAKDHSTNINIDILKEEGLVYLELDKTDKARTCFEEYKNALNKLGIVTYDDKKEMEWINQILKELKP